MQELQLHGLPKRRSARRNLIAVRSVSDLVNRDFTATGPHQLWVTDITEHPTKEARIFCCVVLDAYSRRALGWSIDRIADAALVNSALNMAASTRSTTRNTIIHADHGAQGGFNWSSQHFVIVEVCDGSSSTVSGSSYSSEDEIAWFASASA
jgi:putative transposase